MIDGKRLLLTPEVVLDTRVTLFEIIHSSWLTITFGDYECFWTKWYLSSSISKTSGIDMSGNLEAVLMIMVCIGVEEPHLSPMS